MTTWRATRVKRRSPKRWPLRPPLPAHARLDRFVALDDLVHALVAEVECLGDLTHGAAGRVQPPDRVVVVELRAIGLVLKLEEATAKLARLGECGFV